MIENAGIGDLLAGVISAAEIETYKPHIRLYRYAARRSGTSIGDIAYVSAAWPDILGGVYTMMQGVWVNRQDEPQGLEPFDCDPDLVVKDFHGLADELGA